MAAKQIIFTDSQPVRVSESSVKVRHFSVFPYRGFDAQGLPIHNRQFDAETNSWINNSCWLGFSATQFPIEIFDSGTSSLEISWPDGARGDLREVWVKGAAGLGLYITY